MRAHMEAAPVSLWSALFGRRAQPATVPASTPSPKRPRAPRASPPTVAPIWASGDWPPDTPYQEPDDPPQTIRIWQERPPGDWAVFEHWVPVAGTSQRGQSEAAAAFVAGATRRVELERAPFAGHPEAIRVVGAWVDADGTLRRAQVGWIPEHTARELVEKVPEGALAATVEAMFAARPGKSAGIRLQVLRPSRRRRKKAPAQA